MVSSEDLFEYYFAMRLKNGSTLDFPAGQAGFLPAGPPEQVDGVEKIVVNFTSPRGDKQERLYSDGSDSRNVPACVRARYLAARLGMATCLRNVIDSGASTAH
jgi:hypothetical protein